MPNASNLVTGEVAINTTNGFAYTKTDGGSVVQIGSTTDLSAYAPLASPALSGVPTAPTASVGTSTTQLATTDFVQSAIAGMSVTSARTLISEVRNQTGATLTKGTAVYISGASGNKATVSKAIANTEATSAFTFGIVQNNISNNANGYVVTSGEITGVNTNAYTDGTLLYLSPTVAGGFTATKPSAPNHIVFIGIVTYAHNNNGVIEVSLQNGYQLDELHDVDAILPANDKEILAYTLSDQTWRNRTASFLGLAELSGATFSGDVNVGSASILKLLNSGVVVAGDAGVATDPRSYFSKDGVYTVNGTIGSGGIYRAGSTYSGSSVAPTSLTNSPVVGLANFSGTVETMIGDGKFYSNTAGAGWVEPYLLTSNLASSLSNYAQLTSTQTFTNPQVISSPSGATLPALRITNEATNPAAHSLVVEDVTNPDVTSFIVNNSGNVGIGVHPATWTPSNKVEIVGSVLTTAGKATFTPTNTLSPSLNLGATACASSPTNATNGDIWITNVASPKLAYKTGGVNYYPAVANQFNTFTGGMAITGTTASNPQLQITQSGTAPALQVTSVGMGNALVVEDSSSTDGDAFIINANGNVGVGVASGWTPVGKLDVNGTITATTPALGTNSTLVATTEFVKTAMHPQVVTLSDGQYAPNSTTAWQVIYRLNLTSDASIQLPTNAYTQAIGAQYVYLQMGSGRLDFTPTNGNTVMSAGGKYFSIEQYSVITAIKTGANEWLIAGDLSAS